MLTTEINTIYQQDKQTRKVHHVVFAPSLEVVEQINEELKKIGGNLGTDGRLMLFKSSPEVVERLMNISSNIMIIPAHVWTPWFGCLGSKSGFDTIENCYQDQIKHIHALETGLSSDPAMNWRLSSLDKFCLMSNSDSHSPWPWRLGRECNVFDLDKITYSEITSAIKKKDKKRFLFTIEVDPAYGKYHWSGHRKCGIQMSLKEALKTNNICPKCGRKLTVGVEQRVEELADRSEGFIPNDAIPFKKLIPLSELIKTVLGIQTLYSQTIWKEYNKLIEKFDDEFNVLLDVSREDLEKVSDKRLVDLIMLNREGKIKINPGYDGVYGEPIFEEKQEVKTIKKSGQKQLLDF
ncbi:MAG: DNA helicase UvrD [Candidatus Aenigmarchaeota archaeon]|nr:DNA helicase UvrD [Candidatus Aenigmarchaeota archaeon]